MKILSYADLGPLKGIHYSRAHLRRLEKAELFPKHIQVGPRRIGWLEDEIDACIAVRAAARSKPTGSSVNGLPGDHRA